MKIILVGANGFVGSAFQRLLAGGEHELLCVTRANYAECAGTSADIVIEAACNSKKFFAEERPFDEFAASVGHRLNTLRDFPAPLHLHISSVDVYPDLSRPETTKEDQIITPERTSFYGLHKLLSEELVRKYARQWVIVRLAGMVGPGLRKNPVFDILHGQPLRIHPESQYQFLSTDEAVHSAWSLLQERNCNDVFNICGRGTITPFEIARLAGKPLNLEELPSNSIPRVVDVDIEKIEAVCPISESRVTIEKFLAAPNDR